MEEGSRSPFPSPQQKLIESLFTHCCFDSTAIVGLAGYQYCIPIPTHLNPMEYRFLRDVIMAAHGTYR